MEENKVDLEETVDYMSKNIEIIRKCGELMDKLDDLNMEEEE